MYVPIEIKRMRRASLIIDFLSVNKKRHHCSSIPLKNQGSYLFSIFGDSGFCSSGSFMDFLNPLIASPRDFPRLGSLPGPKIIRIIIRTTSQCMGENVPENICIYLLVNKKPYIIQAVQSIITIRSNICVA